MDRIYKRLSLTAQVLRHGGQRMHPVPRDVHISKDDIREIKQFFPMDKFFIFGHARSGTTLLARLIRVHPEVHCNWQAHFFTRSPFLSSLVSNPEVRNWLSNKSNRWNQGQDLSPSVMRAVADFILERDAISAGKKVVGDKSPNNLTDGDAVYRMANIYPDAKLIFIIRDGRDAILSHQIQKFIDVSDQLNADDLKIRQAIIDNGPKYMDKNRSIFSKSGLSRAANAWVKNVTETHHLGMQSYSENYFSLRFEDLVENPLESLHKVWRFLEVDVDSKDLGEMINDELNQNPDRDWQSEKQQQVADIIHKGLPGSWRDIYTDEDIRTFKRIAGETLIEWGYEDDLDW